jgi:hypothetical protein
MQPFSVSWRDSRRPGVNLTGLMTALGHLQTCPAQEGMSASPLKADIRASGQHVRCGPKAEVVGAAGQLLRKTSDVPDARDKPDDFIDLGGVMSWIKSLSASVSNGLRNILKFGAADFAASL